MEKLTKLYDSAKNGTVQDQMDFSQAWKTFKESNKPAVFYKHYQTLNNKKYTEARGVQALEPLAHLSEANSVSFLAGKGSKTIIYALKKRSADYSAMNTTLESTKDWTAEAFLEKGVDIGATEPRTASIKLGGGIDKELLTTVLTDMKLDPVAIFTAYDLAIAEKVAAAKAEQVEKQAKKAKMAKAGLSVMQLTAELKSEFNLEAGMEFALYGQLIATGDYQVALEDYRASLK